jgi:hypothetical protein
MAASMIGLTYGDRLTLTWYQWLTICIVPLLPGWYDRGGKYLVLLAFLGRPIGIDSRLLYSECTYLHRFTWTQFISELSHRNYVWLQNPLVTFFISRAPVFVVWQIGCFLCIGDTTPTPLSLLMMTQPGPDLISFLLMKASWRACQPMTMTASWLYGAACIVKLNALVFLPIMAYKVRGTIIISLVMVTWYLVWLRRHHVGRRQLEWLSYIGYVGNRYSHPLKGRINSLKRRAKRYHVQRVVLVLGIYLFPLYLSLTWEHVYLCGALLLLAPNSKYFLLVHVP